jgi:hypothetical protein
MSSMSRSGPGFSTPAHPQTGNTGPVPSLGQPRTTHHGDTGIAGEVQEKITDLASGAADTARRWAGSAADAVEHGWDSTRQGVIGAYDEANAFVRRHPGACLLAAFGMGALVAGFLTAAVTTRESYHPQW